MKVADLFAVLSLKADKGSFSAGDKLIGGIKNGAQGLGKSLTSMAKDLKQGIGQGIGQMLFGNIKDAIGGVFEFERALTRFKIAGNMTAKESADLAKEMGKIARESGLSRDEILKGAKAYQTLTGDTKGAIQSASLFAKIANATGTDMEAIARTANSLTKNLKIDPKDFKEAFSALVVQGDAGAVELEDMAARLSDVAPDFAMFQGGTGIDGMKQLGASLQILRDKFGGDFSNVATGLRGTMNQIVAKADKLKKAGVQIFNKDPKTGKKSLKGFLEIVTAIGNSKLAKDPALLIKTLTPEAAKSINALNANKAVLNDLVRLSSDQGAIDRKSAEYRESAAARWDQLLQKIKTSVTDLFSTERVQAFVDLMGTALGYAVTIAEKIAAATRAAAKFAAQATKDADDPFSSVGAFVGALAGQGGRARLQREAEADAAARGDEGYYQQSPESIAADEARWAAKEAANQAQATSKGFSSVHDMRVAEGMARQGMARGMAQLATGPEAILGTPALEQKYAGVIEENREAMINHITTSIKVEAPNADPKAVAMEVRRVFDENWDSKLRDLAEGGATEGVVTP